jgi:hypothetical protein
MNGKGSSPRPTDLKRFGENYDRIFRRSKRKCRGVYLDTSGALKLTDAQLETLAQSFTLHGEPIGSATRLRELCRTAHESGLRVLPKDGCTNYDARGYCLGHDD